jgi:hypothetical protein
MNQVDMQKMSDDDLVEGLHAGKVIFFEAIYHRYASNYMRIGFFPAVSVTWVPLMKTS